MVEQRPILERTSPPSWVGPSNRTRAVPSQLAAAPEPAAASRIVRSLEGGADQAALPLTRVSGRTRVRTREIPEDVLVVSGSSSATDAEHRREAR